MIYHHFKLISSWLNNIKKITFIIFAQFWLLIFATILLFFPFEKTIAKKNIEQYNENNPVKISIMSVNPPFSMLSSSGKPIGLYVDIWNKWSEVTGIPVLFKPDIYQTNIEMLREGKADFHAGLFINKERLKWADFSIPIHSIPTELFVHENSNFAANFSDLANKTIGVGADSFQHNYLKRYHPEIKVIAYKNYQEIIVGLLNGDLDAVLSESPYIDAQLELLGIKGAIKRDKEPLFINTVHAMVPKGDEKLMELINQGISKIDKKYLIALEEKWLPNYPPYFSNQAVEFLATLTFEQQTWLRKIDGLKVSFNSDMAPIEFKSKNGIPSGISLEYLEYITKQLNLKINIVDIKWPEALDQLRGGKIDLLPAIEYRDKQGLLDFSETYISFPYVIVTNQQGKFIQNIEDLYGNSRLYNSSHLHNKVGVIKSYRISEIIQQAYPDIQLTFVENINDGLRKVETGELVAYIGNLASVSHYLRQGKLKNIKIASFTTYHSNFSFALNKKLKPLIPIINKILKNMGKEKKNEISNNWLAYQVSEKYNINKIVIWSLSVLLLLASVVFYILRSNKKMKKQIASRIQVENKLEQASIKAQRVNQLKDEFLSNVSHEIRTPMNAIVGITNLLSFTELNSEQKDYLDTINHSADVLLVLIDDILNISDMTHNNIKLNLARFELGHLIKNIIKQASVRKSSKYNRNISIECEISSKIPKELTGDPLRLGQLLANLLSNSLKFTKKGQITISAKLIGGVSNDLAIEFCVADTGIGMNEEQQKKLFKTYSQTDISITRKYGGTGLGLSICKNICQLMGGEIWVESALGKGSQFYFTAIFSLTDQPKTLKICSGKKSNKEGNPTSVMANFQSVLDEKSSDGKDIMQYYADIIKNKHILIVDDNPINITIARKMLERVDAQVTTAINGVNALEKIKKNKFDAVLMDLQMPVMDGYQTTRMIRENSAYKNLPIIAFSANVMTRDVDSALAVGMNDHLAKPLKILDLFKVLAKYILTSIENNENFFPDSLSAEVEIEIPSHEEFPHD